MYKILMMLVLLCVTVDFQTGTYTVDKAGCVDAVKK